MKHSLCSAAGSAARAVVLAGAGAVMLGACATSGGSPIAASSDSITTLTAPPETVLVETSTTIGSPLESTVPPTTAAPTTTAPVAEWTTVESFPSLAYLPCCASNRVGQPSPELPADPASPLAPGMYSARQTPGTVATDSISIEVQRFEACAALAPKDCPEGYSGSDEMGVTGPARPFTLPLDGSIRVGLSGFDCEPDQQIATGTQLAPLLAEFEASYHSLIGGPFSAGDPADVIIDALAATPTGGFGPPVCADGSEGPYRALVWRGSTGPPVLLQSILAYDYDTGDPIVPISAANEWMRLTSIEIAADGTPTLYFYAGYFS